MSKEIDLRKGIHISLQPATAAEFRILLIRKGLSMQEVFEEFCQRAITGDRACAKLIDAIVDRKRMKIVSQMTQTDAESIFDAIEIDEMAHMGSKSFLLPPLAADGDDDDDD